jgi:hypothetical protein
LAAAQFFGTLVQPRRTSVPRQELFVLALSLALWSFSGCGDSSTDPGDTSLNTTDGSGKITDLGNIVTIWRSTQDTELAPLVEALRTSGLVEDVARGLNDSLRFPRDVTITHMDCGEEDAYYAADEHGIVMCYELLKRVAVSDSEEDSFRAWSFMIFHELGHALIAQYNIPIAGKGEDAADDISTLVLIGSDLAEPAVNAATYWANADARTFDNMPFAAEHALRDQRFFGILCTVFGSDPERYGELADGRLLPEARVGRCLSEYDQKTRSWNELLAPYAQ